MKTKTGHYNSSNPTVARTTMSAYCCEKTSVSREADFVPGSSLTYPTIQRRQVTTNSSSKLCATIQVVASSSLEEVQRITSTELKQYNEEPLSSDQWPSDQNTDINIHCLKEITPYVNMFWITLRGIKNKAQ